MLPELDICFQFLELNENYYTSMHVRGSRINRKFGYGMSNKQCSCGYDGKCGGRDGVKRRCNCDVGDGQRRADAGTISTKWNLPVISLHFTGGANPAASQNVTIDDLVCSPKSLSKCMQFVHLFMTSCAHPSHGDDGGCQPR